MDETTTIELPATFCPEDGRNAAIQDQTQL